MRLLMLGICSFVLISALSANHVSASHQYEIVPFFAYPIDWEDATPLTHNSRGNYITDGYVKIDDAITLLPETIYEGCPYHQCSITTFGAPFGISENDHYFYTEHNNYYAWTVYRLSYGEIAQHVGLYQEVLGFSNLGQLLVRWDIFGNTLTWYGGTYTNMSPLVRNPELFPNLSPLALDRAGRVLALGNGMKLYLLTPVPEPASLTILALGILTMLRKHRKI